MPAAVRHQIQKIHNLTSKQCYLNQRVVRPPLLFFHTICALQIPNNLFNLALTSNISTDIAPLLHHRQREGEVETQHLEGILAPNHRVAEGIPKAGHLLGETVTAHATRLSENVLILLIEEDDHTPGMTGVDHTPPMKGDDPTLPMAGDHTLRLIGQTLPTTGVGPTHPTIGGGRTHPAMIIATVQDLHTITEGGGLAPTTVLFQHTTEGTILQGTEDTAILAAYRQLGATPAAAPWCRKNQGAVLHRKDMLKASHHAAGHI